VLCDKKTKVEIFFRETPFSGNPGEDCVLYFKIILFQETLGKTEIALLKHNTFPENPRKD
jgi:hypothetical protein